MLKRMRTFAAGFLAGAIFFGTVAYAATGISVDFLPIKFVFDGVEKQMPSGQYGFIYQGRTYVPLRFVSESIGKDVSWDSGTQTAYIGNKPASTSAPVATVGYEKYTNVRDGYSFNVVKGCTFTDNPSAGTEVVGSTSIGSEVLIIKVNKSESVLEGASYDVIANITLSVLKSNPDYKFISSEKVIADGFETLHCVYSQQLSNNVTYYVHEYYIMSPNGSYDLNFITQTEPSKDVVAVINEAMRSFKELK